MEKVLISELMERQNELYHYGVLGMHWGVRRYQPYSLIPRKSGKVGKEIGAAKKSSKSDGLKSTISKLQSKNKSTPLSEIKKSRKQKQEEVKSQKISDEKTARERKLRAAEVVNSGNAKLIYENRNNLTEAQLKTAISRIQTENTLRALVSDQNPSKMQKVINTANKLQTAANVAESGINAYNQVARVANAFMGENETGRKNTLPYIGKAQNSFNQPGGISSENRDFITKAKNISDLMNAASKLNPSEAKLATSKAESIEKLRKLADAEKDYNKTKAEANNSNNDVSFDVSVETGGRSSGKTIKKGSVDNLKVNTIKTKKASAADDSRNVDDFKKSNPFYDVSPEPRDVFRKRTTSERQDYLQKSLSDIKNGAKPKTSSAQEKADKKRFDDYFESEVRKQNTAMTSTKISQARALLNAGYTQSEVAKKLGVSVSTISKNV